MDCKTLQFAAESAPWGGIWFSMLTACEDQPSSSQSSYPGFQSRSFVTRPQEKTGTNMQAINSPPQLLTKLLCLVRSTQLQAQLPWPHWPVTPVTSVLEHCHCCREQHCTGAGTGARAQPHEGPQGLGDTGAQGWDTKGLGDPKGAAGLGLCSPTPTRSRWSRGVGTEPPSRAATRAWHRQEHGQAVPPQHSTALERVSAPQLCPGELQQGQSPAVGWE